MKSAPVSDSATESKTHFMTRVMDKIGPLGLGMGSFWRGRCVHLLDCVFYVWWGNLHWSVLQVSCHWQGR